MNCLVIDHHLLVVGNFALKHKLSNHTKIQSFVKGLKSSYMSLQNGQIPLRLFCTRLYFSLYPRLTVASEKKKNTFHLEEQSKVGAA